MAAFTNVVDSAVYAHIGASNASLGAAPALPLSSSNSTDGSNTKASECWRLVVVLRGLRALEQLRLAMNDGAMQHPIEENAEAVVDSAADPADTYTRALSAGLQTITQHATETVYRIGSSPLLQRLLQQQQQQQQQRLHVKGGETGGAAVAVPSSSPLLPFELTVLPSPATALSSNGHGQHSAAAWAITNHTIRGGGASGASNGDGGGGGGGGGGDSELQQEGDEDTSMLLCATPLPDAAAATTSAPPSFDSLLTQRAVELLDMWCAALNGFVFGWEKQSSSSGLGSVSSAGQRLVAAAVCDTATGLPAVLRAIAHLDERAGRGAGAGAGAGAAATDPSTSGSGSGNSSTNNNNSSSSGSGEFMWGKWPCVDAHVPEGSDGGISSGSSSTGATQVLVDAAIRAQRCAEELLLCISHPPRRARDH